MKTGAQAAGLRGERGDPLTRLVLEAPASELGALLDNPALREDQLLLLLRRKDVPGEVLQRIADQPAWASDYLVKAALVANPHTPKVTAAGLVKFLFWRDLAKLVGNVQIEPQVRRMAEVVLRDRLGEITLGERVALARIAPREVIKALRAENDERVVASLLANSHLIEEDVVLMAQGRRTAPAILAVLARSERWTCRNPVRLALLRNPRTPTAQALALLPALPERDLKNLAAHPAVPAAVRAAAARALAP